MYMDILLLQGGSSPEREVSLRSGENVATALRELGHHIETYDTREGNDGLTALLARSHVVFPVLHGAGGEDGLVQQMLDSYHVAYVGSGPEASRLCFDKIATKKVLEENALPTPRWEEVNAGSFAASPLSNAPYVLKPRRGGSSVDTFIVRDPAGYALDMSIFEKYKTMLLEELIVGTELTVAMLGSESLPVIEIVPPEGKEFDYDNKYNGATEELCPPRTVPEVLQEEAQSLAEQANYFLGVRHFSRIDMMLSKNGELFILEVNTIPGLSKQSLFPKAAACAGLPMTALVKRLLEMAQHGEQQGHY